jgi:cell division protein ZapA
MTKRLVTLYGKEYNVNCDPGQESRLAEIVRFVEDQMGKVAGGVGNTTESRLLMLTCMHLADELLDLRSKAKQVSLDNEDLFVAAVEHLQNRVAHIASQVGSA